MENSKIEGVQSLRAKTSYLNTDTLKYKGWTYEYMECCSCYCYWWSWCLLGDCVLIWLNDFTFNVNGIRKSICCQWNNVTVKLV